MNRINKRKSRKLTGQTENLEMERKPKIRQVEVMREVVDENVEEYENMTVEEPENSGENENNPAERDENVKNESESEEHENDDKNQLDDESNDEDEKNVEIAKPKKKRTAYNPDEEARLERLVFGDACDVIKNLEEYDRAPTKKVKKETEKSTADKLDDSDSELEVALEDDDESHDENEKERVAWVDQDDLQYSVEGALEAQNRKLPKGRPEKVYTELLENKFTQIVGTPKWASLEPKSDGEDGDSDDEILKRSNHLTVTKEKKLKPHKIEIKALTDINKSTHTEGPFVTSVQFHPTSTVAMVAGTSGVLSLFQIDGRENTKLQSIRFDKFRIDCAQFLKEGSQVIVGSRDRSFCHVYDLMSGKTHKIPLPHGITNMQKFVVSPNGKFIAVAGRMGQIHLLSSGNRERIADLKMNKKCLALAFSPDSETLLTHGESDEMYFWDLKNRNCMHKASDDGCIAGSAVEFSPSGQFIATGSKQGVVNVYDTETVLKNKNPAPLKIVLNLVTPISKLKFNPTSEILGMASQYQGNAFKMLHLPSFTVFDNFPTFQTQMYNPLNMDFSPSSGYLSLTNDKGHAYLYRLKHYGNY